MAMIPQGATWVRFPRFVGDAVMQMPVLRFLRLVESGPIVVWGPRTTVELVENSDLCDVVLCEDYKPSAFQMASVLRQYAPTRSIHFPKSLRTPLAAWLAGVPERIGVDESLAGYFNTVSGPFWKTDGPFVLRYHAVLRQLWPDAPSMPYAAYAPNAKIDVPPRPYIVFVPGSTWKSKCWPVQHFRELLLLLRSEGLDVVILGAQNEYPLGEQIAKEEAQNLCGKTTLKEAASWLKHSQACIGNDSGLSHLAGAIGIPTLTLYGATDPLGSLPWGPKSHAINKPGVPCAPCFKSKCFVDGHPCMTRIQPMEVFKMLKDRLETSHGLV